MPALYSAAIGLYQVAIRCAALWDPKAKAWIQGRQGLWERLEGKRDALRGCLWMHCASAGEFEQGRPILEAIKRDRPSLPVLLTFFSSSGYEARKDYELATHVEFLPADNRANAERLVELIAPRASIFVKYEFWYHHLRALRAKRVPLFLVSAAFREGQPFFRWFGGAWRTMLRCYTHIFTQDERSRVLLADLDPKTVSVGGDTRFDRVMQIVSTGEEFPVADSFRNGSATPILVCGSTWPADEQCILSAIAGSVNKLRIIIAPHELRAEHLRSIEARFPKPLITWSEALAASHSTASFPIPTLLVDHIGLLSRLYRYGDVAYVGGGFGDGIHNLLEAAAWGKPVIFGPHHHKFAEAAGLIEAGGGCEVRNAEELKVVLDRWLGDPAALAKASEAAARYVRERVGATERILKMVAPYLD
jgi:3-deoxy-D-manno-octulosonic-acid transferase